ncbi:hypothetical protein BGZ74_008090 [Mortierella antarctica]|nr:hypothetical protein BGZ74_008090 [Mortierella antarctica]
MAATVEKIVEKLTSEIEYTFLTDFFLIYRLFITPMALLKLLIARFQWALAVNSPQRQIVRVRTFVTLRHWLLNYFGYDFMSSKALRQTLIKYLAKLKEHPLVVDSTRDQRIIRELGRYTQSLKKLHYRNVAQQKLSQQQKKRREDRTMTQTHLSSPVEWSDVPESGGARTRPSSSNRSSSVAYGVLRKSMLSEATTEELTVEFRSSDQSDDEDEELDDSSDDGFEPSSENSQCEDDDYGSQYTASGDENQEAYSSGEDEHLDQQGYSPESAHYQPYSNNPSECHLPSPAFSPRSVKSPLVQGSFHPLVSSVVSSTASRAPVRGARPAIPDFQEAAQLAPDNFSQSFRHNMAGRRASNAKYPRPLSMVLPPDMSTPSSAHGSMRSIEPYMNPPPRSIASTEKKNTWSKYMSATVGRLSKMKRVFSSKKGHRHTNSSTSTHSLGSGKVTSSMVSRARRPGNQSDPEGEKLSHYLLGSCTGMNLVSSSDDHRLSIDRKYTAERDQRGSGSSDEEYSQYEMNRHSHTMARSEFDQDEHYEPGHPLDTREVHRTYEIQERHSEYDHDAKDACSECEREQSTTSAHQDQGEDEGHDGNEDEPEEEGRDYVDEQREGAQDSMQASMGTRRVPNLRRTNLKKDRNHRASWMTLSSTNSSVFGAILSEDHLSPRQGIRDRNRHGNVDRFVERLNAQQPSPPATGLGENTTNSRRKSVDMATASAMATPSRRRASWMLLNSSSMDKQGSRDIAQDLGDKDASTSKAYNPKRQTAPIVFLHHHFHHHLADDKPMRRHSYDVQSTEGWQGFQNALQQRTGENKARSSISKASLNPTLTPNKSVALLEGATLMAVQDSSPVDLKTDPPQTPTRASHAHALSRPLVVSSVRPNMSQGRSNSHPHLLYMSDPEFSPPEHPLQCRHRGPQRPGLGTSTSFTGRFSSYRLQSTHPLDVQFLNPPIPRRTRVPPLVLRYRSELIAQQLCLIEREMLSQIQWYELVDAGTKNKAAAAAKTEAAEQRLNESVLEGDVNLKVRGVLTEGEHGDRSEGTATPTPALAGKLSRRAKEENDGIKRLVDRFNVTCQWVSSDILKTQELDMRVRVVEKFIRIAKTCYNHSNFSSLMQIMLALQSTPVSRLYRTWSRVRDQETEIFADLVEFTSPFHNWRHLRETMKNIADDWGGAGSGDGASGPTGGSPPATSPTTEKQGLSFFSRRASKAKTVEGVELHHQSSSMAMSQSTSHLVTGHRKMSSSPMLPSMVSSVGKLREKEKPQKTVVQQGGCIPFLGLYLSDLVFNTEIPSYVEPRSHTNKNSSPTGLVNIHKHRTTATIIKRILTFRNISARYPFREEAEVHALLVAIEGMDPSEMQRLSHQLEERVV